MGRKLVIDIVRYFAVAIEYAIFARVIISWLPVSKRNMLVKIISLVTEPILKPIRDLIYKSPIGGPGMVLDFSPIIAVVLIEVLFKIIVSLV